MDLGKPQLHAKFEVIKATVDLSQVPKDTVKALLSYACPYGRPIQDVHLDFIDGIH